MRSLIVHGASQVVRRPRGTGPKSRTRPQRYLRPAGYVERVRAFDVPARERSLPIVTRRTGLRQASADHDAELRLGDVSSGAFAARCGSLPTRGTDGAPHGGVLQRTARGRSASVVDECIDGRARLSPPPSRAGPPGLGLFARTSTAPRTKISRGASIGRQAAPRRGTEALAVGRAANRRALSRGSSWSREFSSVVLVEGNLATRSDPPRLVEPADRTGNHLVRHGPPEICRRAALGREGGAPRSRGTEISAATSVAGPSGPSGMRRRHVRDVVLGDLSRRIGCVDHRRRDARSQSTPLPATVLADRFGQTDYRRLRGGVRPGPSDCPPCRRSRADGWTIPSRSPFCFIFGSAARCGRRRTPVRG